MKQQGGSPVGADCQRVWDDQGARGREVAEGANQTLFVDASHLDRRQMQLCIGCVLGAGATSRLPAFRSRDLSISATSGRHDRGKAGTYLEPVGVAGCNAIHECHRVGCHSGSQRGLPNIQSTTQFASSRAGPTLNTHLFSHCSSNVSGVVRDWAREDIVAAHRGKGVASGRRHRLVCADDEVECRSICVCPGAVQLVALQEAHGHMPRHSMLQVSAHPLGSNLQPGSQALQVLASIHVHGPAGATGVHGSCKQMW